MCLLRRASSVRLSSTASSTLTTSITATAFAATTSSVELYVQSLLLLLWQLPCLEDTHQVLRVLCTFALRSHFYVLELFDPGADVVALRVVVQSLLDGIENARFAARIVAYSSHHRYANPLQGA
ncbi:hypothetical protein KCU62_g265, partial [Aureobasidium sp. EXF-3399]